MQGSVRLRRMWQRCTHLSCARSCRGVSLDWCLRPSTTRSFFLANKEQSQQARSNSSLRTAKVPARKAAARASLKAANSSSVLTSRRPERNELDRCTSAVALACLHAVACLACRKLRVGHYSEDIVADASIFIIEGAAPRSGQRRQPRGFVSYSFRSLRIAAS